MYKNILYLTVKLTALAAVIAYSTLAIADNSFYVVAALAFCCLFLVDFLINRMCRKKYLKLICAPVGIAGCLICGAADYFPLLIMLLFEFIDLAGADSYFYHIAVSAALLSALIFSPSYNSVIAALIITAVGAYARIITEKLVYWKGISEEQGITISRQSEKISELKTYSGTLRDTVAIKERNRFSARIHDKLGHGISGSIILLEGVKASMGSNPAQAEKCLETAIENLRGSVESIREALHEERPRRYLAGMTELKEMLQRFSLVHEIKTDFSVKGDSDKITPQIWSCLQENLTEAMTNTMKHSDAEIFSLHISVYDKMIRAEFSDNGSKSESFEKGIGLEAIEERTVQCGGKCLFQNSGKGFMIINIFRF